MTQPTENIAFDAERMISEKIDYFREGKSIAQPRNIGRELAKELIEEAYAAGQASRVPDGWQLVPIEPTQEMCDEGGTHCGTGWLGDPDEARQVYAAMLSASPKAGE